MAGEWKEVAVEEIASKIAMGPFGSDIKTDNFVPSGVPVIRGVNLTSGRFHAQEFVFLTKEKADELANANTFPGDIVFTHRGTLGQVGLIPHRPFNRYVVSQSQMKLTCDPQIADPAFIYYFFRSPIGQYALLMNTSQTGVPAISRPITSLKCIRLSLPSLPEQRAIAHILGTLDDKIELNRRMNETLEAIAQALFKSRFTDATEDGLPEGWRVISMPDAVEINPPRSLQKGEVAPYVDMQNMPTRGHRPLGWINREFGSGMRFVNGDTLLARITPCLENGKTAFVDWLADGQVGWGSTEYIVLRPKPPLPPEYGYYLARSEELRAHAIQNMTGSSGRQRVQQASFAQFEVAISPEPVARRFGEIAKQLMGLIRANDEQSRTLAALRDTLLPKLLTGEIRVSEGIAPTQRSV